jgi:hypothetical protein
VEIAQRNTNGLPTETDVDRPENGAIFPLQQQNKPRFRATSFNVLATTNTAVVNEGDSGSNTRAGCHVTMVEPTTGWLLLVE